MAEYSYHQLEQITVSAPRHEYHATPITSNCKKSVSKEFNIPKIILDTYLRTENADPGHIRTNSDNTWDVGPMQINSVNWSLFYERFGVSPLDIRFNGCINLMAGAYLIRAHLDRENPESIKGWEGFYRIAANYHSKTDKHNKRYQDLWIDQFQQILEEKTNAR